MGTMAPMPEEEPISQEQSEFEVDEKLLAKAEEAIFRHIEGLADGAERLIAGESERYEASSADHKERFLKEVRSFLPGHSEDIVLALDRAADDFSVYRMAEVVPVLRCDEGLIPVSMRAFAHDMHVLQGKPLQIRGSGDLSQAIHEWSNFRESNKSTGFGDAVNLLGNGLKIFLTNRLGGLLSWERSHMPEAVRKGSVTTNLDRQGPTSSDLGTGLFNVSVNNRKSGYRILVSPAYFIDWVYFGAPSYPVRNTILPGRYIFGTDSVDGTVTSDGVIFRIPTDFNPQLTRF